MELLTMRVGMIMAGGCVALLSGCRATLPAEYASQPVPTENTALVSYVGELPYVSAEPAYRSAYYLWKRTSYEGAYGDLARELAAAGLIRNAEHAPSDVLTRSEIGYLLCRALDIKVGLNWTVSGLGRYAWRDLCYLGIASPPNELGYVSGGQFLGILQRADDYHRARFGSQTQRADLGSPPE